jgi:tRNA pseudouridine38-40 synthase
VPEPAVPEEGDGGLVRLRLDLGYDGTAFAGWARQPGQRTVQEVLEEALRLVLRLDTVSSVCAGRTDAGVHARGQVVHVDVPRSSFGGLTEVLGHRVAGVLPADVGLRDLTVAPPGFHARFSPLWRRYAYRVSDAHYGVDPLRRHDVLGHRRPLDLDRLNAAAARLLGEHDFAAYCKRRPGATTVRTLLELHWERDADGLLVATLLADAFCHNMVRSLVGALLAVGDGRRPESWPATVLEGCRRTADVHVAPARGLTLEEVRYPDAEQLADRARVARRRRDEPS